MIYYVLLVLLILLLRNIVTSMGVCERRDVLENRFCFFIWFVIILMAAFRSENVGGDTPGYIKEYSEIAQFPFEYYKEHYKDYIGYYSIEKLFSLANMPLWIWFAGLQALYAYSIQKLINLYSKDKLFSILAFVTLGLFTFSMAGLKQVMAMSFMLISFVKFVNNNYIKAVLLAVIAYSCHHTSLIFLPIFALFLFKDKWFYIPLLFTVCCAIFLFGELLLSKTVMSIGIERYESYLEHENRYTSTTLIYYALILLMSLMGTKRYLKNSESQSKFLLGVSLLVVGLQLFASFSPHTFRLPYFYSPFMAIFISSALSFDNSLKLKMRFIVICCMVFYFLYTNRVFPYEFRDVF